MILNKLRQNILKWVELGYIKQKDLSKAVNIAELTPTKRDKQQFLDIFLVGLGSLMLVSGVIFFFAYNWQSLSYKIKFLIAQVLILLSVIPTIKYGLNRIVGKISISITAVLIGVLLALIGQTYQTGADTYQLFLLWALIILPIVFFTKFSVLWLLELLLINTAIILYYRTFRNFWGFSINFDKALIIMFNINLLTIVIWEITLKIKWVTRLLVIACIIMASILFINTIYSGSNLISILIYLGSLTGIYAYFRRHHLDALILSCTLLSIIFTSTALLIRIVDFDFEEGALIFIGIFVIAQSALAGWWLKRVLKENNKDE